MLGSMNKLSPVVGSFIKTNIQLWSTGLAMRNFSSAKENHEQRTPKVEHDNKQFIEIVKEKSYKVDRYSLTPHQLWITQGKGIERPYTGEYWDNKEHGHYECIVCSNKLFLYSNFLYVSPR